MQKLQTQNELLEARHFQVEELEERIENCWQGTRKETVTIDGPNGSTIEKEILVPCAE